MRTKLAAFAACVLLMGAGLLWADDPTASKEVTLKGTLECAKCALHETDKCQNVLVVKDGDKETKYYLDNNAVSTKAHKDDGICTTPKQNVSVTGVVSEKDGKKTIAATKIDVGA